MNPAGAGAGGGAVDGGRVVVVLAGDLCAPAVAGRGGNLGVGLVRGHCTFHDAGWWGGSRDGKGWGTQAGTAAGHVGWMKI